MQAPTDTSARARPALWLGLVATVSGLTLALGGLAIGERPAGASEPRPAASIRITSPRGGQTRERVVKIAGTVNGVSDARLTLVLNGVPLSIPRSGETFDTTQVLAPGLNTIRVLGGAGDRGAWDEVSVHALVPPKDLRVTLTWDTPGTDVDLWVTGPDGEKIFYQHKQGAAGGTLDTDVTTGFGPETYTQARTQSGTYRVQAHYYSGVVPSRVEVTVIRGEGSPQEERRTLRGVLLAAGDVVEVGEFSFTR